MLLHPALSLFVDGEVVREAIIVTESGDYYCYPCISMIVEIVVNLIAKRVLNLMSEGLLVILRDYLILYLRRGNIVLIPVSSGRVLALVLHRLVSGEDVALHTIESLKRLRKEIDLDCDHKVAKGPVLLDGAGINEIYVFFVRNIVKNNLAIRASVVRIDGAKYSYPADPSVPENLVRKLLDIHEEMYRELRYRSIRVKYGDTHIIVLPLDADHIVVAEVDPQLTTQSILRVLSLHM